MKSPATPSRDVSYLIELLRYLRSPKGCPWDREQTNLSLLPYLLEEAYEVAEAVTEGSGYKTCEELGDLLLQIVFYSILGEEQGLFDFGDVVLAITNKIIRRHPHVFGDKKASTAAAVEKLWAEVKTSEGRGGDIKNEKIPALPGLLLIEKYAEEISVDTIDDQILRELVLLVQKARQNNRCLEAEVRGFFEKTRLSSRSLPIDGE